jgi:hypothetical protein
MKQFVITPAAGKRLIAKALVQDERILSALERKTLVIVEVNSFKRIELIFHRADIKY